MCPLLLFMNEQNDILQFTEIICRKKQGNNFLSITAENSSVDLHVLQLKGPENYILNEHIYFQSILSEQKAKYTCKMHI